MSEHRRRILGRGVEGMASSVVARRTRGGQTSRVGRTGELKSISDGDEFVSDLLKTAKPNIRQFRHGKYTHVSDVIHRCVRQIALSRRLGIKHQPSRLFDGHALTYAQGDAIHDFIKKRFVEGHPDKVWARWACACGQTVTQPMLYARLNPAFACPNCKQVPNRYVEYAIEDDEHEVVGSPDLLLYLQQIAAFYLTEIKSMAKDQWDALVRPVPDHVIQGLFYWSLMHRKNYSMVDQFSIVYVKKEFSFKWPYKEFIVRPQEEMDHLKPFVRDLELLVAAKDPKAPLPPRVVCSSPQAPEAKNCGVCVTCFQLDAAPVRVTRGIRR